MGYDKGYILVEPLNNREREILSLIAEGNSNREIAQSLYLSLDTVKWYNKQLFNKLDVHSRTQAVAVANKLGLFNTAEELREKVRPQHNLPYSPTSFVGRVNEKREIKRLLGSKRLVALTGTGGTGKTRLALEVAWELIDYYPDGVWLVEFASISNPRIVPNAISDILGVREGSGKPILERLQDYLRDKQLLLVLDNFEHLLEAAPLVNKLITATEHLSALVTSRERLRIYGEQEYPIQPLTLPNPNENIPVEELLQYDAIDLFVRRARAVQPDFSLNEELAIAVVQICTQLDGLPLALELAASRIKMFPPTVLAELSQNRLGILTDGSRDLPRRQRTLRSTIAWSYDTLEHDERMLLARLAVFSGGGTLESVDRICAKGLRGGPLARLNSLVDKSLVRARKGLDGELRFDMLETIHEFAWERLKSCLEEVETRNLHTNYFADLAEHAEDERYSSREKFWYECLLVEKDNIRAALAWSLDEIYPEPGLRLVAALHDFWIRYGYYNEGLYWSEKALARMKDSPLSLQAGVLRTTGGIAAIINEQTRAKDLLKRSIEIYQRLGDEWNATWSRVTLSSCTRSNPEDYDKGIKLCQKCATQFREWNDLPGLAYALNTLGELTRLQGKLDDARGYYEESLEICKQSGERLRMGIISFNLGILAYRQERHKDAIGLFRLSLECAREFKNDYGIISSSRFLSGPFAELGQPERAARILGATDALFKAYNMQSQPWDAKEIEHSRKKIQNQIGDEAYQAAWEAGSRMRIQQLLDDTSE